MPKFQSPLEGLSAPLGGAARSNPRGGLSFLPPLTQPGPPELPNPRGGHSAFDKFAHSTCEELEKWLRSFLPPLFNGPLLDALLEQYGCGNLLSRASALGGTGVRAAPNAENY